MRPFPRKCVSPQTEQEIVSLHATVKRFLATSRQPVLMEAGDDPIRLSAENFFIELTRGRLMVQAWDEHRNIVRRVVGLHKERPGRLELSIERFGRRPGLLTLADRSRPRNHAVSEQARRATFREQFRRSLLRQFPGWKLAHLSSEAVLEHSLSPVYPRALVHRGGTGWAAIAAPVDSGSSTGVLAFGLIWLDYLRKRERRITIEGLVLLLPEGSQQTTCLRLHCLNPKAVRFQIFLYAPDGYEQRVDPNDYGNLQTRLEIRRSGPESQKVDARILEALDELPETERIPCPDGSISYRVRGIEFARYSAGELLLGIDRKRRVKVPALDEVRALAAELARLRRAQASDRNHSLFTRKPEAWLESQVRAHLEVIDPTLISSPVYGEVPAFAAGERGVLDLLAADHRGRLTVLELKAAADPQLPMQALDYWIRVRQHTRTGEFSRKGYFPGVSLSAEAPRLLLVAPSLEFHSTTEILLRYFRPEIDVDRIGVTMDWKREVNVVFRLQGAKKPEM